MEIATGESVDVGIVSGKSDETVTHHSREAG